MPSRLGQTLLLSGTIGRREYFTTGIALFLLKFVVDWSVARAWNRTWTPLNYLVWPDRSTLLVFQLPPVDQRFGLMMLAVALPFIWIGVTLTLQRLRDAQLPLAMIVLFFIPVVNLLFILALCLIPSAPVPDVPMVTPRLTIQTRRVHRKVAGESTPGAFLLALIFSVPIGLGIVFLSANVLQSYGFGVFIAAPFITGWVAAVCYGVQQPRSAMDCVGIAVLSTLLAGFCMIGFAMEGIICIVMAAPIAFPLAVLGGLAGYATQSLPWANDSVPRLIIGLFIVMPALLAAESMAAPEPEVRSVRTEVIISALPERVWQHVVSFPPLPEPTDWFFRTGIAYPQRAEIHGTGVGAVRHCVFSTGAFVEPIEVWEEPKCLAFRVTEQPPPMEELSPFHTHPPHLDNFLVSRYGEFRLESLADGRTRLTGTTWYTNRMWPVDYWGLWSDYIIGRVHGRVLDHVRGLAESR